MKNMNMEVLKPFVIWIYGLPSSGKTTIANELKNIFLNKNISTTSIDGDDLRKGLNSDLGFSEKDRNENLRRAAEVSNLLLKYSDVVICSFITPLERQRSLILDIIGQDYLIDIALVCPIETCIQRDVKGLYQKALQGKINNLTGLNSPFESSITASITLNTDKYSLANCVEYILSKLIFYHKITK